MASLVWLRNGEGVWTPSGACENLSEDREFWRIYHQSFPAEEKEPDEVILTTAADPLGLVLVFRRIPFPGSGAPTVGLCTLQYLPGIDAAFLVYLAVNPEIRGKGLGSGVLAVAMDDRAFEISGLLSPKHRLLEVENPDLASTEQDRRIREKRLAFFARANLSPLYSGYVQPPLQADTPPLSMLLLSQKESPPDVALAVAAIYREKYQRVNGLDAKGLDLLYRRSFDGKMP